MGEISLGQSAHAKALNNNVGFSSGAKNQGTLTVEGKESTEHTVTLMDSSEVSKGDFEFVQSTTEQQIPTDPSLNNEVTHITPEMIEVETEIADLEMLLSKGEAEGKETATKGTDPQQKASETARNEQSQRQESSNLSSKQSAPQNAPPKTVHSSIFSLARSINSTLNASRSAESKDQNRTPDKTLRQEPSTRPNISLDTPKADLLFDQKQTRQEKDREKEDREGSSQHQEQQEQKKGQQKEKQRKLAAIPGMQASRETLQKATPKAYSSDGVSKTSGVGHASRPPPGSMDSIFIRFMALMARILGQAEAEGHDLYLKIKDRTDSIDVLTLLISKVNSEKGSIDWTKNEEMKALIEKARAIGVDIPKDKLKWSEEEKKLLKENIQMRKDSMEKMTQLERTDMQRYLQEASQCHQARSNVLKLLKEVADTLIANMRP